MSKMDNLRAMREARFERSSSQTVKRAATARPKISPAAPVESAGATDFGEETDNGLCGHRAISGRTCTRERGHPVKSHRYS